MCASSTSRYMRGAVCPILIHTNDGTAISLSTENLHVLANIVDPMCGYELCSRCLNRVANDKSFSKHLRPTAMFITCKPQGRVKEHSKEVVVLETSARGTVFANDNDPVKVVMVLEQAQELLARDNTPNNTTEMEPNELFLQEDASPVAKRGTIQGQHA